VPPETGLESTGISTSRWGSTNAPFNIKVLRAGNQRGVPRGFVRSRSFRLKSTDVDPPNRVQVKRIRVTFTRGKVTRRVTCTAIIVHVGKSKKKPKKRGKEKHVHVKPPKIPISKCTGGCGGQVATAPPPKGTTKVEHKVEPGGKVKLKITTTHPLEGFTIPLIPPNPTPRDPPLVTGDGPIECEIVALELSGGPAALRCTLPGGQFKVDSFFDIDYRIEIGAPTTIQGTLDNSAGLPLEGFTALPGALLPPQPAVGAGGALFPGPTPDTVGFGVKIDANNGLACDGADIVNGEQIDGTVTLSAPDLPPGSVFFAQGPATGVEGPFGFGSP